MEPKERHVPRSAGVKSHKRAEGSRKVKPAAATPDNVYRRMRKVQRLSMELQAPLSLTTVLAFGTKSSQHHHHHHRLLAKRKSLSADILPQQQPPPQPPPSVIQWEPLIHQSSSVPTVTTVATPPIPSGSRDSELYRSSATSISASASAEAAEVTASPTAAEAPRTPAASEPASLTPYYCRPTRTRSEDVTNDADNGGHHTQHQRLELHQTASFPAVPALLRQYHHHEHNSPHQQHSQLSHDHYVDEIISKSIVPRHLEKKKAQTPSPQASRAKMETATIDLHNPTSSCPQLHISPSLQAVRFNCAKLAVHHQIQQPQPRLHQIQQQFPVQLQRPQPSPVHRSQPRSLTGEEPNQQTLPQYHDHLHHRTSPSFQQDPPHTPGAHHKEPPQVPLTIDDDAWTQEPHTSDPILMTSCQFSSPYSAAAPQQHVAVAVAMTTPGTFQGQQQQKWDGGADIDKLQCRKCSHSIMENEARKLRIAMATGTQVLPTGFHVREDRCVTCGELLESHDDHPGEDMKPAKTPTSSDDDVFSPGTKLIVMAAIFNVVVIMFVIAAILHAQGVIDLTAWFRATK